MRSYRCLAFLNLIMKFIQCKIKIVTKKPRKKEEVIKIAIKPLITNY